MRHGRQDYQRRIVDLEGLIPDDEPVFLLRGQDRLASAGVYGWARAVQLTAPETSRLSEHARRVAHAMIDWHREHFPVRQGRLPTVEEELWLDPTAGAPRSTRLLPLQIASRATADARETRQAVHALEEAARAVLAAADGYRGIEPHLPALKAALVALGALGPLSPEADDE